MIVTLMKTMEISMMILMIMVMTAVVMKMITVAACNVVYVVMVLITVFPSRWKKSSNRKISRQHCICYGLT